MHTCTHKHHTHTQTHSKYLWRELPVPGGRHYKGMHFLLFTDFSEFIKNMQLICKHSHSYVAYHYAMMKYHLAPKGFCWQPKPCDVIDDLELALLGKTGHLGSVCACVNVGIIHVGVASGIIWCIPTQLTIYVLNVLGVMRIYLHFIYALFQINEVVWTSS